MSGAAAGNDHSVFFTEACGEMGAAAGDDFTVVFTEAGELFTCGCGRNGQLGHGGDNNGADSDEFVLRLVEGELAGKKVAGAAAGDVINLTLVAGLTVGMAFFAVVIMVTICCFFALIGSIYSLSRISSIASEAFLRSLNF